MKGLLARKVGMTQLFSQGGEVSTVTVLEAGPCWVTQVKTKESDGYDAIQVGFGVMEEKRIRKHLNKAERGHLGLLRTDEKHPKRKAAVEGLPALEHLRELRVPDAKSFSVGQKLTADTFAVGEIVEIEGISKGKGFAGAIKRHHFHGGKKTHGQSNRQRSPGSSGATTTPGRVLKGMRRAGHMGDVIVTQPSLKVIMVDAERNLLAVRGSVPGSNKGMVIVRSMKKAAKKIGKK